MRNVFVIGPDKKIKLILVYPMTTGRNFDEVLRVIDSLQLTANHKVATPAQWQQGDKVIIAGSVNNDQAKETLRRLGRAQALHPHRSAAELIRGLSRGRPSRWTAPPLGRPAGPRAVRAPRDRWPRRVCEAPQPPRDR